MANHELGTPVADLGEVPGVQGGRGGGGGCLTPPLRVEKFKG